MRSEKEMRESKVPTFDTPDELMTYINGLVEPEDTHDYGTCVYAMSMAATAAFNFVAHKLGVTGFQASCADMDILARTRGWKHGFRILNYADLLYPQYRNKFDGCNYESLLIENGAWLRDEATKLLTENGTAHPAVREHWQRLASFAGAKEIES